MEENETRVSQTPPTQRPFFPRAFGAFLLRNRSHLTGWLLQRPKGDHTAATETRGERAGGERGGGTMRPRQSLILQSWRWTRD